MINNIDLALIFQKLGISPILGGIIILIILIWSVYWKGRALWTSARGTHTIWFVAFLLVNTLGVLEILYIYVLNKDKRQAAAPEKIA
ncbi:MAG: DUF5652 family protein [Candidatus Paceibacterota bacterium]|jgi:hypothetical protein